jgi:hypothetical protein
VVSLLVFIALAGGLIGRWWTLAIPVVVWPIWFLGLAREWWGYGMGDGWQYGAAFLILVSLGSVAIALTVRALAREVVRPRSPRPAR